MDDVGRVINRYRTNGTAVVKDKNGEVLDSAPKDHRIVGKIRNHEKIDPATFPFFATDHNKVYTIASRSSIAPPNNVPPERAIFGLPHQYRFSSLKNKKVSFDYVPSWTTDNSKGRRASPLFIHVAAFTTARNEIKYRPLLLLLPTVFLPRDSRLDVSVNSSRIGTVPGPTDYGPIEKLLNTKFAAC
jgi:hypothetical protein